MLRILALVVTIALGDSLNPSTIGPALYVASGDRARVGVLEFTLAVFVVHLVGGAVLVLGPGQLLLSVLNALSDTARAALEIAAVVAMIVAAASLWHQRGRLAQKELPNPNPKRKSSLLLEQRSLPSSCQPRWAPIARATMARRVCRPSSHGRDRPRRSGRGRTHRRLTRPQRLTPHAFIQACCRCDHDRRRTPGRGARDRELDDSDLHPVTGH